MRYGFTVRNLLLALVLTALAMALAGCGATQTKRVSPTRTSRTYAVVKVRASDTLKTLANRYLEDPGKSWIIASYNRVDAVHEGDVVVIPLVPINLGGIGDDSYQSVTVLTYSGFSEDKSDAVSISRADFEKQMNYIKEQGFTPISIDRFYDFLEFKEQAPAKGVVITIDDVGQHTYDVAYPVLKKFGYPAAVFVATDMVSGEDGALSWDQLREMSQNGITVGHASKTLRNLTRRQPDESFEDFIIAIDREITVPTLKFKTELGEAPGYFAYPFGATNELVISLLKKNGLRGGLTLAKGSNPFFTNNYLVRRNPVPGTMSIQEFAKLFEFSQKGGAK